MLRQKRAPGDPVQWAPASHGLAAAPAARPRVGSRIPHTHLALGPDTKGGRNLEPVLRQALDSKCIIFVLFLLRLLLRSLQTRCRRM